MAPESALPDEYCPECGAPVPGRRAGCQRVFDETLARESGDYRYARAQRLMVDAYSLQHPADYMRSAKSYAAHLTGMYASFECDGAPEVNRAVQVWLNGTQAIQRPDNPGPRQRGALTIAHVYKAGAPEDHAERVREWAQSVWDAWRGYRHVAQNWVEGATGRIRTVRGL